MVFTIREEKCSSFRICQQKVKIFVSRVVISGRKCRPQTPIFATSTRIRLEAPLEILKNRIGVIEFLLDNPDWKNPGNSRIGKQNLPNSPGESRDNCPPPLFSVQRFSKKMRFCKGKWWNVVIRRRWIQWSFLRIDSGKELWILAQLKLIPPRTRHSRPEMASPETR